MAAVTTLTLALIGVYARDTSKSYTIRQLAQAAGKPYANTHAAVQQLLEDSVLTKQVVGHSHLCSINLNDLACLYLALWQRQKTTKNAPKELADDPNVIMVWQNDKKIFLITKKRGKYDHKCLTEDELLADKQLFRTIGRHTLLHGHAAYAELLARGGRQ